MPQLETREREILEGIERDQRDRERETGERLQRELERDQIQLESDRESLREVEGE